MREEPENFPVASLVQLLATYWGIDTCQLEYVPVGAGSYHWIAEEAGGTRWFVTADELRCSGHGFKGPTEASLAHLRAAYETAAILRDANLSFVVASVADRAGELVRRVSSDWAVAAFPYIEGRACGPGEWTEPQLCARAAELVGLLHATNLPTPALRWSPEFPERATLLEALSDLDRPWRQGPYGERTRLLLVSRQPGVQGLLARHDELAAELAADDAEAWVVTHGEPHSANFIRSVDGSLHLIDWDTVRLAPRERDLFALLIQDPLVLAAYQRAAGRYTPRRAVMELFQARWILTEICEYVVRFRGPHGDTLDDRASWEELVDDLPEEES
jgi:spectinomycin phosphotransferase